MRSIPLAAVVVVLLASPITAQTPSDDVAAVSTVASAFHAGLRSGDGPGVMRLLAPDAVLLEAGGVETRAEYEANHLPADIEFERVVSVERKPYKVTVVGAAAWVVTTAEMKGTFQNRPVDSLMIELMVLSKDGSGWRIRSIHWSSRARRPAQ